ncbi:N-acetyltransferase [Pseudomonas sp. AN3A02]|uniref:GNAT family N-acetyltransferase n=1 Tax=Pseudomonas sp. AN3A02 TaxID=2719587 RepID=UPI0014318E4F|nr:GNAT family N-acetyltransferase [Pseudomonas sp. AN3A02]NIL19477.1 GNAT family N-acetyltransferase [Pseudomonas sp. AN3A02]
MISIKQATVSDCAVLRDIGIETYTEHFSAIWSPAGMQDFLDKDFSPESLQDTLERPAAHCWLLARDEQARAVGFAKVNWNRAIPSSDETGAELQKIYFLKSEAGKGHGQQLLDHVLQLAHTHQQPLLWLEVLKTNESAQRFYQRCGFERLAEIPFSTDITAIPMVVMSHRLAR